MKPTMIPPMTGVTITHRPRWFSRALLKAGSRAVEEEQVGEHAHQLVQQEGNPSGQKADAGSQQ